MATNKPVTKTLRRTVTAPPPAPVASSDPPPAEAPVTRRRVALDEEVLAIVPTAFKLQLSPGVIVMYEAGPARMPRSHAEHDYAKANGVTLYDPDKK